MSGETKPVAVNILGRVYQIIVSEEEESDLRESEKELQNVIDQFKQSYAYHDDKDLLAMAALQFVTKALFFEKECKTLSDDFVKKLNDLDKLFDTKVL